MVQRKGRVKGVPTNQSVKYTPVREEQNLINLYIDDGNGHVYLNFSLNKKKRWETFQGEAVVEQDNTRTKTEKRKERIQQNKAAKKKQHEESLSKDKHIEKLKKNEKKKSEKSDEPEEHQEDGISYADVVRSGELGIPAAERMKKVKVDQEILEGLSTRFTTGKLISCEVVETASRKEQVNKNPVRQLQKDASERFYLSSTVRKKQNSRKNWEASLMNLV